MPKRSHIQERPLAYIQQHPTSYSVALRGVPINLTELAIELRRQRTTEGTARSIHGHLSRVLAGRREASPYFLRCVSDLLEMSLEGLMDAIKERAAELLRTRPPAEPRRRVRRRRPHASTHSL